jgi:hypothetical protein
MTRVVRLTVLLATIFNWPSVAQGQENRPTSFFVQEGARLYRVETGVVPVGDEPVSIQPAQDGYLMVQFKTADRRTVIVQARGFDADTVEGGTVIRATGPGRIQYAPRPRVPGVLDLNRFRPIETREDFELRMPREGTGSFRVRVR